MAWCNIDNHPLFLTGNHVLEYLGQLPVVGADFKAGVDVGGKPQHGLSTDHPTGAVRPLFQIGK